MGLEELSGTSQPPDLTPVESSTVDQVSPSKKQPNDEVYILWYISASHSHAAIVVDDKPFGALIGNPTQESKSLKALIPRVEKGQVSFTALALQRVKVTPEQYKKIKEVIARFRPLSSGSCMDAVFRILESSGVDIKPPPNPVRQYPDVSRDYLAKLREKEGNKILGKLKYYGKSEDIKKDDWKRYLTNTVALPIITGVVATLLSSGLADHLSHTSALVESFSHVAFPVGIGLTGMATVYSAYITNKVFAQLEK